MYTLRTHKRLKRKRALGRVDKNTHPHTQLHHTLVYVVHEDALVGFTFPTKANIDDEGV